MSVEMTGAEWVAFYNDHNVWGDYGCHDFETLIVDGEKRCNYYEELEPTARVELMGGYFYKDKYNFLDNPQDLETIFLEWQKSQDSKQH